MRWGVTDLEKNPASNYIPLIRPHGCWAPPLVLAESASWEGAPPPYSLPKLIDPGEMVQISEGRGSVNGRISTCHEKKVTCTGRGCLWVKVSFLLCVGKSNLHRKGVFRLGFHFFRGERGFVLGVGLVDSESEKGSYTQQTAGLAERLEQAHSGDCTEVNRIYRGSIGAEIADKGSRFPATVF